MRFPVSDDCKIYDQQAVTSVFESRGESDLRITSHSGRYFTRSSGKYLQLSSATSETVPVPP